MSSVGDLATIRPFQPDDAQPIAALLDSLWAHDPAMLALYRIHRDYSDQAGLLRLTLVADVGGQVVGVGTVFASTYHPRLPLVALHVAEAWQRQGIGSQLCAALQSHNDGRAWCAKMTERDTAGMAFLAQHGYHPRMRSLLGVIDPSTAAAQQWLATLPADAPPCRIVSVDGLPDGDWLTAIAQVQAAIYTQFHRWNPPSAKIAEQAVPLFCGPNVIPGSYLCVYDGDELVGAGNLLHDPVVADRPEAYLVNFGALAGHPQHDRITAGLLRRLVTFAAKGGLRVRFEADASYLPHHTLLAQAPAVEVDRDFVLLAND